MRLRRRSVIANVLLIPIPVDGLSLLYEVNRGTSGATLSRL